MIIELANCSKCDVVPAKCTMEVVNSMVLFCYECPKCHKSSVWTDDEVDAAIYWNETQIKGANK